MSAQQLASCLPTDDLLDRLEAEGVADRRTAVRYLAGLPVRPKGRARIVRFLLESGHSHLVQNAP